MSGLPVAAAPLPLQLRAMAAATIGAATAAVVTTAAAVEVAATTVLLTAMAETCPALAVPSERAFCLWQSTAKSTTWSFWAKRLRIPFKPSTPSAFLPTSWTRSGRRASPTRRPSRRSPGRWPCRVAMWLPSQRQALEKRAATCCLVCCTSMQRARTQGRDQPSSASPLLVSWLCKLRMRRTSLVAPLAFATRVCMVAPPRAPSSATSTTACRS
mmetsp:Transcript_11079/g.19952  ORF Transcript_11079/g.19952 Transcript_11079/m.19952 type:complete len:214 (+) Transcript_11079:379-1020(+)